MNDKKLIVSIDELNKSDIVNVLENIGDGFIVINASLNIIHINRTARQILNVSFEEAIGKPIEMFFCIQSDDSSWNNHIDWGTRVEMSMPRHAFIMVDGEKKYISAHISPLFEDDLWVGYSIVFRDVSKYVRDEENAEKQKDDLAFLFEILPVGMAIVDKELNIYKTNKAFEELFRSTRTDDTKPFGEIITCINSRRHGCGKSLDCMYCSLRNGFNEMRENDGILKNTIFDIRYYEGSEVVTKWVDVTMTTLEGREYFEAKYLITIQDITAKVLSDLKMNEARKLSVSLLNSLPLMIFRIDKDGECDFISNHLNRMMPMNTDNILIELSDMMSVESNEHLSEYLSDALIGHGSFKMELELNLNEQERPFTILGKPYWNQEQEFEGIMCLMLDNHELNQIKNQYLSSQNKYYSLIDNLDTSIIFLRVMRDPIDGNVERIFIVEKNKSANDFLVDQNVDSDEFESWEPPFYKDVSAEIINMISCVESTGIPMKTVDVFHLKANKWFNISMYKSDNDIVALLADDIDQKKRFELDLKRSMESEQEASKSKSEFLTNMSHEIRTPLNGIVGMIDLTMLETLTADQQENLTTARKCVDSLIDIINDILDFSKIEAGKLSIENKAFSIGDVLETIERIHLPHLMAKGLELIIENDCQESDIVITDEKRLMQVINNLMSNAVKFTEKGRIELKSTIVKKPDTEDGLILRISCKDTGVGIAKENHNKLFRIFSQIDGSFTRKFGGTGLGLVISKQLALLLGGDITFDSVIGKGSKFILEIPVKLTDVKSFSDETSKLVDFKGQKILLVEDDRVNQLVIGKMLESMGITVEYSDDGERGLESACGMKYDMIIMDIQMPNMDGLQATQAIRNDGRSMNTQTKIVALTAYALKTDEALFRASGMDDYLSKPTDRIKLQHMLEKNLYQKKGDDESLETSNDEAWTLINERIALAGVLDFKITKDGKSPDISILNDKKREDIERKMSHFKKSMEEADCLAMEIIAHQLKESFAAISSEEIKSAAFRIELDVRKNKLERVKSSFESMENMWRLISK